MLKWDKSARHLEQILKNCNGFVAGGFAVNLYARQSKITEPGYSDIDIFFTDEQELIKARDYLIAEMKDYELGIQAADNEIYPGETARAITYRVGDKLFQLIKIRMGEIPEVLETFDFENSKAAFCWDNETNDYRMTYSSVLTELLVERKVRYRIQDFQCTTDEEKKHRSCANMSRLDRYITRYPGGFFDLKSREDILFQYLWNLNNWKNHKNLANKMSYILSSNPLANILKDKETTKELLVMFCHLGPEMITMIRNRE